jgi:hypothetical protein
MNILPAGKAASLYHQTAPGGFRHFIPRSLSRSGKACYILGSQWTRGGYIPARVSASAFIRELGKIPAASREDSFTGKASDKCAGFTKHSLGDSK